MSILQFIVVGISAFYCVTSALIVIAISVAAKRDPETNRFERHSGK